MRRTQIYLGDDQDQQLDERARALGVTKSAVIRDAIDRYLAPSDATAGTALERFRAAVAQAAGVAPYLPSGADYVDEVRAADSARAARLWGDRT